MSPAADRNLLFGILALQMDFITRDQLVAGMNAWVLDKSKPLGQILQEQRTLDADNRAWLDAGVAKHLAKHNNDPQQSLAALSPLSALRRGAGGEGRSLREDLQKLADSDMQATLSLVSLAPEEDDPSATRARSVGESTSAGERFRILRPHAEGGLGRVSVARDEELGREVALKEIKERYADDPGSRGRFLLEAEITGGLEHPGIVPVYGLGSYAVGRPFYAMRFIRGDSLKEAIEEYHRSADGSPAHAVDRAGEPPALRFRKLLGRFIDVCNAIDYAHSRGILHRDLKPGNIMLGKYGETLVVDWGLGKPLGKPERPVEQSEMPLLPRSGSGSVETIAGQALGTPAYMSPEQAAGRLDLLGPASDVYSLGATLYCLLTGRAPFEGTDVGVMLANVQKGEFPQPRQVQPSIDPALDAICQKAMANKPPNRYVTPRLLADDIEHWLADEPVSAWPEPWTVKGRRWVGRHRVFVTGAAAMLLVGIISLIAGNVILSQANQDLAEANATVTKKEEETKLAYLKLEKEQQETELARNKAHISAKLASDRADQIEADLAASTMQLSRSRFEENNPGLAEQLLEQVPEKFRLTPWRHLKSHVGGSLPTLRGHASSVHGVSFSADGLVVATTGFDQTVRLWDARTGCELRVLRGHKVPVFGVRFSPVGHMLASASYDTTVKLWDARSGTEIRTLRGHGNWVNSVAFSSDGKTLASGSLDQTVKLWDVNSGRELQTLRGHTDRISSVAFRADDQILASGSWDGTVKLWNLLAGKELHTLRGHLHRFVQSVAFSPDGRLIATGSQDLAVKVWDVETGRELRELRGHTGGITSLAFSPDGQVVLSASFDMTARLWDLHTGQDLRTLRGHTDDVTSVAFDADGQRIATGSRDATAKLWTARTSEELRTIYGDHFAMFGVSADGSVIASGSTLKSVTLWNVLNGARLGVLSGHTNTVANVVFSQDGKAVVTASYDKTAKLWDVPTAAEQHTLSGHSAALNAATFSPDGRIVASASADKTAKLWDARTGAESHTCRGHTATVTSVAFSPDGQTLVTGSVDQTVKTWDVRSGAELRTFRGHTAYVSSVAYSGDGNLIASGGGDGTVRLWDARSDRERRTLRGHTYPVDSVAFSPDSQLVVSSSMDKTVKLWDVHNGYEVRNYKGHHGWVSFGSNGQIVRSIYGGRLKLWDADTSSEIRVLHSGADKIDRVAFSADGFEVYAQDRSGKIIAWQSKTGVPLPDAPQALTPSTTPTWTPHKGVVSEEFIARDFTARSPNNEVLAFVGRGGLIYLIPTRPSPARMRLWFEATLPDPDEHRNRSQAADKNHSFAAACHLGQAIAARRRLPVSPWDPAASVHVVGHGPTPLPALAGYHGLDAGRRAQTAFVDGATFAGILLKDSGRSAKGLVVRAHWAVDQWPEGWQNHETLGGALYRAGDYQGAVRELEAAIKLRNGTRSGPATIFSCHFLTLAHHKLGNQKEAARWQSQAVLPKDANWEDAVIDRYLRREVEAELMQ